MITPLLSLPQIDSIAESKPISSTKALAKIVATKTDDFLAKALYKPFSQYKRRTRNIFGRDKMFQQKQFIEKALGSRIRIDGRAPFDIRQPRIVLGPTLGQSETQIGHTRVITQVSCEIVRPRAGAPQEGLIQFHTDLGTQLGVKDSQQRISDEQDLSRMLEKALRKSRAIDTEGLCIIAGEQVFFVCDCACIAAISAMMHFRRPEVTVKGDDVIIVPSNPMTHQSIHSKRNIRFFDELMVCDPSLEEEKVHDGSMTVVTNIHREVCSLTKAGGLPLEVAQIFRCNQIALMKASEITILIRNVVLASNAEKSTIKLKI